MYVTPQTTASIPPQTNFLYNTMMQGIHIPAVHNNYEHEGIRPLLPREMKSTKVQTLGAKRTSCSIID